MRLFLPARLAMVLMGSVFWLGAAPRQAVGPEMPGRAVFDDTCSRCHGLEGVGGKGPRLIPFGWNYSQALDIVRHGGSGMPAFPESELSDEAVKQIVDYLKSLN